MKKAKILKKSCFYFFLTLFFGFLFLTVYLTYLHYSFQNRFFPNTRIANLDVSGKTRNDALALIKGKDAQMNKKTLFTLNENSEITFQHCGFFSKPEETVSEAFKKGRKDDFFKTQLERLDIVINGQNSPLLYQFDQELFSLLTDQKITPTLPAVSENTLEITEKEFKRIEGNQGKKLNKLLFFATIKNHLENQRSDQINLPIVSDYPKTSFKNSLKARAETRIATSQAVTLTFEDNSWSIEGESIRPMIDFKTQAGEKTLKRYDTLKKNNFDLDYLITESLSGATEPGKKEIVLKASINQGKVVDYLKEKISPKVNIKPRNARFKVKDDKTLELIEESNEGRELLIEKNSQDIELAALQKLPELRNVFLEIKTVGAEVTKENVDKLGIKELIGEGNSNFSGSPNNRKVNIKVGTEKIEGVLIKPGETFSLVETLGEVSQATGYLPELVIKDKKTIAEYGGGLCQIGTTVFRAAMASGLKITERQWHAYPVDYYNPQGTDATIYNPSPDLKFVNDTKNYILIQSEIKGNALSYKFYGTKDNRQVRFEGPEYWDHGWAGNGSFKAKWTQIVVMPDGAERKKTFYSMYKSPDLYH